MQVVGEIVADYLIRSLAEPFRHRPAPAFAFAGYCLFGAVAGGCSLMLAPHHFIATPWQQVANLIVSPLIAATIMACIGMWLSAKGRRVIRLDSFSYGFAFAFAFALVRFAYCLA